MACPFCREVSPRVPVRNGYPWKTWEVEKVRRVAEAARKRGYSADFTIRALADAQRRTVGAIERQMERMGLVTL